MNPDLHLPASTAHALSSLKRFMLGQIDSPRHRTSESLCARINHIIHSC